MSELVGKLEDRISRDGHMYIMWISSEMYMNLNNKYMYIEDEDLCKNSPRRKTVFKFYCKSCFKACNIKLAVIKNIMLICPCNKDSLALLYSKTGVYRGIHYFLTFALKH